MQLYFLGVRGHRGSKRGASVNKGSENTDEVRIIGNFDKLERLYISERLRCETEGKLVAVSCRRLASPARQYQCIRRLP